MPVLDLTEQELDLILQMIRGLQEEDLIRPSLLPVAETLRKKINAVLPK